MGEVADAVCEAAAEEVLGCLVRLFTYSERLKCGVGTHEYHDAVAAVGHGLRQFGNGHAGCRDAVDEEYLLPVLGPPFIHPHSPILIIR